MSILSPSLIDICSLLLLLLRRQDEEEGRWGWRKYRDADTNRRWTGSPRGCPSCLPVPVSVLVPVCTASTASLLWWYARDISYPPTHPIITNPVQFFCFWTLHCFYIKFYKYSIESFGGFTDKAVCFFQLLLTEVTWKNVPWESSFVKFCSCFPLN